MNRRMHDRRRPPKPPHTTTTVAPSPPPVNATHIMRVYDYTDAYSPYVQEATAYYQRTLAPYSVDVQYRRMPPMDGDVCWTTNPNPANGIKMCERLGPGTAGSTGMHWISEAAGVWALASNILFEYADPTRLVHCDICNQAIEPDGYAGTDLVAHELGHSTGNLPHRPNDGTLATEADRPFSCMAVIGDYTPAVLTPSEVATIVSRRPSAASASARGLHHAPPFAGCNLPLPTDEARRRHHEKHHRHEGRH